MEHYTDQLLNGIKTSQFDIETRAQLLAMFHLGVSMGCNPDKSNETNELLSLTLNTFKIFEEKKFTKEFLALSDTPSLCDKDKEFLTDNFSVLLLSEIIKSTNTIYGITNKFHIFEELQQISNLSNYLSYLENIKHQIKIKILNSNLLTLCNKINSGWISTYLPILNSKKSQISVPYKPANANKIYISVDIKEANSTMLLQFISRLLNISTVDELGLFSISTNLSKNLNEINWEQLMFEITGNIFLSKSKHFRQIILGKLSHALKLQDTNLLNLIEHCQFYISTKIGTIISELFNDIFDITYASYDEVLLCLKNNILFDNSDYKELIITQIKCIIEELIDPSISNWIIDFLHIKCYKLLAIYSDKTEKCIAYKRDFGNGKFDLKYLAPNDRVFL